MKGTRKMSIKINVEVYMKTLTALLSLRICSYSLKGVNKQNIKWKCLLPTY